MSVEVREEAGRGYCPEENDRHFRFGNTRKDTVVREDKPKREVRKGGEGNGEERSRMKKTLSKIQGQTDQILGSMADRLTSFGLRRQLWVSV